ncbi:chorion peroxidase-like isoform X2 [Ostrea edulis]|uniref:chorion peroxidase-like isoform X2 n=1 Tax=Ostrea edulis TaxID=37623 RepID=UPI0024AEA02F|nr:chorion peroxidase-like isoform X2 [Ostrea edulis]
MANRLLILLYWEAAAEERPVNDAVYSPSKMESLMKREYESPRNKPARYQSIPNSRDKKALKRIFGKLNRGKFGKGPMKKPKRPINRRRSKRPGKKNPFYRSKYRLPRRKLPDPNQYELLTRPSTHSCNCPYDRSIYTKSTYRRRRAVDTFLEDYESYNNRTIRSAHPVHRKPLAPRRGKMNRNKFKMRRPKSAKKCEFKDKIKCDETRKYRTIDGSCNNLKNPYWGMAETPLIRFVCSAYDDGVNAPRKRGVVGPLPEPRDIRLKIHEKSLPRHELKKFTHFLMAFGQMLSHDILENIVSETPDGDDLDCCGVHRSDPNCIMPLKLRENDPFFSRFGRTCLNFARSEPSPDLNCNFKVRQTITEYTQYIDGSSFYGSDEESYPDLREFEGGRLRTQDHPNGEGKLMPTADEPEDGCREPNGFKCFLSGDGRVNQQATLTGQHTIWLREHNRIAKILEASFASWDDEKIFQEARRIVGAMFQHITYTEYLPLILGKKIMERFDIKPKDKGYFFKGYDPCVNPNIRHGFMAAAFRFGHSMINDRVGLKSASGQYKRPRFRELFNIPDPMYQKEGVEKVMRGLYIERCQSVDRFKSVEVSNHLFEIGQGTGSDLVSTNINRGRDHALPPYMEFRKMCKLYTTNKFSRLVDHSPKNRILLSQVYAHVYDMDLFSAGVIEEPLDGALVGPTFACIIALQFKALKFGDRMYYENEQPITGFSLAQLDEIKKTTLAQVICRNTNIGKVQSDVFMHGLPEVNCNYIMDDIDFSLWDDTALPG